MGLLDLPAFDAMIGASEALAWPCFAVSFGQGGSGPRQASDMVQRTFASPAGSRTYWLALPASGRPEGLVLMLHGCNQTPQDFATGTRMNAVAGARNLAVVYPEQPRTANLSLCWNWFDPANQKRDGAEPRLLAALAKAVAQEFDVPENRLFVAGLSAGGAMTSILADLYGDQFAAAAIHSGLGRGAAHDLSSALAAMKGQGGKPLPRPPARTTAPLILFQGDADTIVHPSNATAILAVRSADLVGAQVQSSEGVSSGGQRYRRTVVRDEGGIDRLESWIVEGTGHAWSGGSSSGSFTDPAGPDASAEIVRFFHQSVR